VIVFAHVSDIHIGGDDRNTGRTARIMGYLNSLSKPLDAVLVTGDITHNGLPEEYKTARDLLASPLPVLTCPGNHDERAAYRTAFLGQNAEDGPVNQVRRVGDVVFALCDSSVPGRYEGALSDETLAWLAKVLAETPRDVPVLICLHHPPVPLHSPELDAMRLVDEERLAELIRVQPHVAAILCGHAHTAAASTFAGRPVRVAPSAASTLRLPWEHGDLFDRAAPPTIAFHVLDDEARLTTHYRVIA
jgi:3',5'-cyclic-AMP phosphodiesterase